MEIAHVVQTGRVADFVELIEAEDLLLVAAEAHRAGPGAWGAWGACVVAVAPAPPSAAEAAETEAEVDQASPPSATATSGPTWRIAHLRMMTRS